MERNRYQFLLVLCDIVALVSSGLIGLYLRFEAAPSPVFVAVWLRYMLLAVPLYIVVYYYFGLYRRIWRYASAEDLLVVASAVSLATAFLFVLRIAYPQTGFPRSVIIMTWLINIAMAGGSRFLLRLGMGIWSRQSASDKRRTIILGAGDAGRLLVAELTRNTALGYRPVGFLDDDPSKVGLIVAGLPVLGAISLLESIVKAQYINCIVIAMPSATMSKMRDLTARCSAIGIKPLVMPSFSSILGHGGSKNSIREVQIEDLLRRPEISLDVTSIAAYLQGKTVLVTGAGGSIGSELVRQVASLSPRTLLLLGRGENSIYEIHKELARTAPHLTTIPLIADISDAPRIEQIFAHYQPQVVFHAAAHKHVPLMEANPTEAVKNNFFGTQTLAQAALRHRAERFVLVSTDKAVNPTSVMGATKRLAEQLIQTLNGTHHTKFMAVRFGNVLGSRGSVVPLFKSQIAAGGPVTVTDPAMTRYFMTIPEAVSLIIQAGAMGQGGEVFVLDMGEPVKILDLARDLICLSGLKPDIDIPIVFTGLRPGEKLYEELLTAEEGTQATLHRQIFVARQQPPAPATWERCQQALAHYALGCTAEEVLGLVASSSATPTTHLSEMRAEVAKCI